MTDLQWETLSNQAVAGSGVLYFLALLAYLAHWSSRRVAPVPESVPELVTVGASSATGAVEATAGDTSYRADLTGRLGLLLLGGATAVHAVALVARGLAADPDRVPWGNMYEFTLAGTFFVSLIYLLGRRRLGLDWLAPLVVAFVLAVEMAAVVWLYAPVTPLTEALNSPWLVIHVVSAVIATGAFSLGGLVSVLYVLKELRPSSGPEARGYLARVPDLAKLDLASYRLHAFGFPMWTFGVLISGPIWAHQAWSSYWNWDPKEVWAFITWVVYAAYLHARSTVGWKGRKAAYLALLGLATLWFNFIGINFFSESTQHGYAAPAGAVGRYLGSEPAQEVRIVVRT
ncbi:MAG: c-type cytochrome biogenesis protein CcsB [Nocardioides sp.]